MPEADPVSTTVATTGYINEQTIKKAASGRLSALAYKHAGYSYEKIAELLELPNARAAKKAVDEALMLHLRNDPDAREMSRALFESKIEAMSTAIWPKAMNPSSPEQLSAAKVMLELIREQAKLGGSYAPTEHHISSPSLQEIERIAAGIVSSLDQGVKEKDIFADPVEIEDAVIVSEGEEA